MENKTYIKMCDCPEIQDGWIPSDWDSVYCKREEEVVVLSGYSTDGGYYGHGTPREGTVDYYTDSCDDLSKDNYKAFHIWLPRQDQLQEMIERSEKEGRSRTLELTERFNGYCATNTISNFTSMEQLWLAFVMKEKYNKTWDGEQWSDRWTKIK